MRNRVLTIIIFLLIEQWCTVPRVFGNGGDTSWAADWNVPSLDFNNSTLQEAVKLLTRKSREADPIHRGAEIKIVRLEKGDSAVRVTYHFRKNTGFIELMRYTAHFFNMGLKMRKPNKYWFADIALLNHTNQVWDRSGN